MHPIAQAMPRALAELLRQTPLSRGKVEFAWKAAVGPAMARGTAVRLESHVLLVEAGTRAWAREVGRASPLILRRMQALVGPDVIREITIRV